MVINKIKNTCSMLELGDGFELNFMSKSQFISDLNEELFHLNLTPVWHKPYTILYNCTSRTTYQILKNIGFKHVFTYNGENGPVRVLLFEVNRKEPWYKRIF